jgi:ABC-type phosphate transport system substrate-binding protein
MKRLASLLLAVLALVAIGVAQGALSINGAGATFPNPMYSKWFDDYHKKHSDIEINPLGRAAASSRLPKALSISALQMAR